MPVTTGLTGRTFASAARAAYLRYGITLLGATVPINDDVVALMPGESKLKLGNVALLPIITMRGRKELNGFEVRVYLPSGAHAGCTNSLSPIVSHCFLLQASRAYMLLTAY